MESLETSYNINLRIAKMYENQMIPVCINLLWITPKSQNFQKKTHSFRMRRLRKKNTFPASWCLEKRLRGHDMTPTQTMHKRIVGNPSKMTGAAFAALNLIPPKKLGSSITRYQGWTTHLNNMRKSNWIMKPHIRDENKTSLSHPFRITTCGRHERVARNSWKHYLEKKQKRLCWRVAPLPQCFVVEVEFPVHENW